MSEGKLGDDAVRQAWLFEQTEHRNHLRNRSIRSKIAATVGIITLGSGVLYVATELHYAYMSNNGGADLGSIIPNASTAAALTSPTTLQKSGACAPVLLAQSEFYSAEARITKPSNNKNLTTILNSLSNRYNNAAKMAVSNHVTCTASNLAAPSLTPDFNLNFMKKSKECETYFTASGMIRDPNSVANQMEQEAIEIDNAKNTISANLAASQYITC